MKNKNFSYRGKTILSLLLGLFLSLNVSAQQIKVNGLVTDSNGEPVIGANVVVKGTTNGTMTNIDGMFSLNAPKNATLQASFIGYLPSEIKIDGKTTVKIVLQENVVALDEVVAIGYGKVKKSDATGSVTAIKADDINRGVATSPQELLMGKSAGVVITTNGGTPGAGADIRIRGGSSLNASNDPLIIIDGVPIDNRSVKGMANPLSTVNPNDIESFTVLKDASATAIYGSRASNGVIIITTKKGTGKKVNLSYSGSVYVGTIAKQMEMLDAAGYRNLFVKTFGENSEEVKSLGTSNTDWQKEIYRTSVSTDHNLSLSGKVGSFPYRVSGSYTGEEGTLKTGRMDRGTASISVNPSFFDNHLKINANIKGMLIRNRFAEGDAVGQAVQFDPTQPIYDKTLPVNPFFGEQYFKGYFAWGALDGDKFNINSQGTRNPLATLYGTDKHSKVKRSIGNIQLDYSIHGFSDLSANLNLGYDISSAEEIEIQVNNMPQAYLSNDNIGIGENNTATELKKNTLLEFYFNYNKEVSAIRSTFDVIAGYSWQHFYRDGTSITMTTPNEAYQDTRPTKEMYNKPWATESYLISLFGRLNYALMDKYLLTGTVRYDGSSRFHPDNRWGLFPSGAFAWKINNEGFMRDQDIMSDLKLRLGYGITGQQDITDNDYPYLANYVRGQRTVQYLFGDQYIYTLRPSGYDQNLKWEETSTANIGIDYGFLNDRINGSIDYYYRKTKDLINKITVPAGSNLTNEIITNIGSLENRGFEFSINTKPVVTKHFFWDLGFNISTNQNKITKLNRTDNADSYILTGEDVAGTGTKVQVHKVGEAVSSFYVYEQIYDNDGKPVEGAYVDQNNDGKIDTKDKIIYHSPAPKVTMGLSSKMTYKDFDFSFNLRSNLGNYVYNRTELSQTDLSQIRYQGYNLNAMKSDNYFKVNNFESSYFIKKASFLRCDNITLGYTFKNILGKSSRMRIYAAVQNPFIISGYNGIDPEIFNGVDNNIYPRPRTYLIGLNITL